MIKYGVDVRGERMTVSVTHKSRALWVATGNFRGKVIVGQGRTEPASLRAWRREAEKSLVPCQSQQEAKL
jgi:hypothetical protein